MRKKPDNKKVIVLSILCFGLLAFIVLVNYLEKNILTARLEQIPTNYQECIKAAEIQSKYRKSNYVTNSTSTYCAIHFSPDDKLYENCFAAGGKNRFIDFESCELTYFNL